MAKLTSGPLLRLALSAAGLELLKRGTPKEDLDAALSSLVSQQVISLEMQREIEDEIRNIIDSPPPPANLNTHSCRSKRNAAKLKWRTKPEPSRTAPVPFACAKTVFPSVAKADQRFPRGPMDLSLP